MSYFTAPFQLVSRFFPIHEDAQPQQPQTMRCDSSSKLAHYNPSPGDTVLVRSLLVKLGLPMEIALQIIDFANYFPEIRGHRNESLSFSAGEGFRNSVAALYVVTHPIPLGENGEKIKIQSVRFRMRSHDQGWGGDYGCRGTYQGSYTWFEASILRPIKEDPPADPNALQRYMLDGNKIILDSMKPTCNSLQHFKYRLVPAISLNVESTDDYPGGSDVWHIQSNVCAEGQEKEHEVRWVKDIEAESDPGAGKGEKFLETLRPGDSIGIWARAMFPGWVNFVEEVDVHVEVKVD